jgi:hypothetical protein
MEAVEQVDPGGELRVFAWLSAHEGKTYPPKLYCAPYRTAGGQGNVSWTKVATVLAKIGLKYPRLVGFSLDDFYTTMIQPGPPGGQIGLPSGGPLNKSAIVEMRAHMRKVNPAFKWWPTIYFSQMGLAFPGGCKSYSTHSNITPLPLLHYFIPQKN